MIAEFDTLLPFIHRYAPSCPDPLAFNCIIEAAREACERGLFWRENDTINITGDDFEGLCTVEDASIIRIEHATMDGCPLEPVTVNWLDENYPEWTSEQVDGSTARYITQLQPNTVTLYPKVTGTVSVRLILKPSRRAQSLPAFLVEQYAEQIGFGAAYRVMMTPDIKVSKPDYAVALRNDFERWLDGLNVKAAKGQQRGRLRTKGQYF
jgi:hypothetical protein